MATVSITSPNYVTVSRIQNRALRRCVIVALTPIMIAAAVPLASLGGFLWFCWAVVNLFRSAHRVWK